MMTPQEVSQHAFSKAMMGGYNMAMVDEFLDTLTEDYTTLFKENAVLKSKMKVLVEKIEEYRSTEDAMRSALLAAQKMANTMVEEAKAKREELLESAESVARDKINSLQQEIADEQARLASAKRETAEVSEKIRGLYAQGVAFLENLDSVSAQAPASEDGVLGAVREIESSLNRISAIEDDGGDEEEPAGDSGGEEAEGGLYSDIVKARLRQQEEPDSEITMSVTRRIDFKNLQFGKNYENK
ncbi:DivIVA domain-containing protein [Papillibacter cinnamivorans]|uniref:Cell division initiation protein n=1 Tax=Papillibacter cinnamivorans DSM 12816 TaxID=1122930 RepID=A0A1W2A5H1_9FIRM|nr:DivIVA domain-containing protein [Papillibacter cinnamivorans]SMC55914.1 cell division initiation protein [Papillibacter cinnamivorans DSM 12816]